MTTAKAEAAERAEATVMAVPIATWKGQAVAGAVPIAAVAAVPTKKVQVPYAVTPLEPALAKE